MDRETPGPIQHMNNSQVATLAFLMIMLSFLLISQFYCPMNDLVTVYTVGTGVRISEAEGHGERSPLLYKPFILCL